MTALATPVGDAPDLGRNLKTLRASRGMSLAQLSAVSFIPQSTLSKVENREMSLNFEKLIRLAQALNVGVEQLFALPGDDGKSASPSGRRVIDPKSEQLLKVDHYRFRYLCTELKSRNMVPIYYEVGDRAAAEDPRRPGEILMTEIIGERFTYVLEGPVEFHSAHYEMRVLNAGDSIYVDASMPHAFVSSKGVKGKLLSVVTSDDEVYMEAVRKATTIGDPDVTPYLRKLRGER